MSTEAKTRVQQQFGAHAAAYVSADTFRQGVTLGALIEAVAPRSGQRALDVATGGGHIGGGVRAELLLYPCFGVAAHRPSRENKRRSAWGAPTCAPYVCGG